MNYNFNNKKENINENITSAIENNKSNIKQIISKENLFNVNGKYRLKDLSELSFNEILNY